VLLNLSHKKVAKSGFAYKLVAGAARIAAVPAAAAKVADVAAVAGVHKVAQVGGIIPLVVDKILLDNPDQVTSPSRNPSDLAAYS